MMKSLQISDFLLIYQLDFIHNNTVNQSRLKGIAFSSIPAFVIILKLIASAT